MLASSPSPLIWPLLNKLNPRTAYQQRPRSANPLGITRLMTVPWDNSARPRGMSFGPVEGTPTLWELALWNIGQAALGTQPTRLRNFLTNPRAQPFSEQRRVPGVVHSLALWQFLPPAPPPRDDRQAKVIVWPLRTKLFDPKKIVSGAPVNTNLQASIHGLIVVQQNPVAAPQTATPSLPWKAGRKPSVVHAIKLAARIAMISGVTKDSVGAILGSCVVELYETATDIALFKTTSDASTGAFTFTCARYSPATHYLVAYKAGGTDVAGTTVNTVTGS